MPSVERLTQQLLQERRRDQERRSEQRSERPGWQQSIGSDPYLTARWQIIRGGSPGYLPAIPMRQGMVGFFIVCRACGAEFESKGMAYCKTCLELPAEQRHAMYAPAAKRMCQGPDCENPIPATVRVGTRFCSTNCREKARREAQRLAQMPRETPEG